MPTDSLLMIIADYVADKSIESTEAYLMARYCLMDALGCGLLALRFPECYKHLGPIVPGTLVPNGISVPGTSYRLDPIKAAFDLGAMIRWLDYNDTWLSKEWGHPSDNLAGILIAADYAVKHLGKKITMRDLFTALIKAYEIQGILAIDNSFNEIGIDHVVLVKIASAAVIMHLVGGNKQDIVNCLSQVFVDGQSLRAYRHAPNAGSRKSWAAADASSTALRFALMTLKGEKSGKTVLSAKRWGFEAVFFQGKKLTLARELNSYVIENILFKIAFPAEFHAQTAVEGALKLHNQVKNRLNQIERVAISTQEPAVRIISKEGPLNNPADRDHCLQYMVAIALIYGELTADHYEENISKNPEIDLLRGKMAVSENISFTKNYYDLTKRGIGNSIQIFFADGSSTEEVTVEYPLGHRLRREESIPQLIKKYQDNFSTRYPQRQYETILSVFSSPDFENLSVSAWQELLVL